MSRYKRASKSSHREVAAENLLRLPENSSTSSAAGTMRLKRLIKPPAQPVVHDFFPKRGDAWGNFSDRILFSPVFQLVLPAEAGFFAVFSLLQNCRKGDACKLFPRPFCLGSPAVRAKRKRQAAAQVGVPPLFSCAERRAAVFFLHSLRQLRYNSGRVY